MRAEPSRRARGVTLIELMIVVAITAVILTLAAPSFSSMIQVQRLRSIHGILNTDFQFARSEAVRLRVPVHVRVQSANAGLGACYIIYTDTVLQPPFSQKCDCQQPPGSRCSAATTSELRTVVLEPGTGVDLVAAGADRFGLDPFTGTMYVYRDDAGAVTGEVFVVDARLDAARKLRTEVGFGGRVRGCTPAGSTVSGVAC